MDKRPHPGLVSALYRPPLGSWRSPKSSWGRLGTVTVRSTWTSKGITHQSAPELRLSQQLGLHSTKVSLILVCVCCLF